MKLLPWGLHLSAYFQSLQLVTSSPTGLRFFLSFSRTNPPPPWMVRVKLQSRGVAGLRHVFPWKSSEGDGMAACGVMVCSPYNCREADWLAQAELLLPRCITTGPLEWGPVGCTHSSISPRHSPLWPWSRRMQSYAGWRWGFVPTVSTVEPIFLGSRFQIFGFVPGADNPENPEYKYVLLKIAFTSPSCARLQTLL